ncbi:uncharacterized protein MELLADRAFT_124328 [Melampsora larici-populina 98AG31]|uniref:Secreted protein n=1 Tax=Melampsora larici-populina (strain 98AG31 / pathotype 3-4-7) TaxID=747676 RepID=F4RDQ0_MELLP|nr:uncharacterized protein MELLADRAFT_124328 [Melampsora larici-populina 98AG31]EGG09436.1 secreted protein [Melampsora larici-populina 98AG31]
MKQRTLLLFLLIDTYFALVLGNLFTKTYLKTVKDDDIVHNSLADRKDMHIQEFFWDTMHDDSWKTFAFIARSFTKTAKRQMQDCGPSKGDSGLEVLRSLVDNINRVFIPDAAPKHQYVIEDLKTELAECASKLWRKYKSGERARSVDDLLGHILRSALSFKIFEKQILGIDSMVQSRAHLSADFCLSSPAQVYAEGFQASIGFLNMVEHLVIDGLKERKAFKKYPLIEGVPIPFKTPILSNKITSRIMHQNALLTWWKVHLNVKDPYGGTSDVSLEQLKHTVRGFEFIGSQEHINVWKSLLDVVVTTGASTIQIRDKLPRLKKYPKAVRFFRRLMHIEDEKNLGILEALYKILEIFEACHDEWDQESLRFSQDVINELFMFNENTLYTKRETIVQRAKYMVMWWMLSESIAKTIMKFWTEHGMYFEVFDQQSVLRFTRYLWHFMDEKERLNHGLAYKNRQERNSFVLGRHYFIYIGCQLHLQDLIINKPSNLWPMTGNLIGSDSLDKILSLEKGRSHPVEVEKDLHSLFSEYMRASVQTSKDIPQKYKESESSKDIMMLNKQTLSNNRKFNGKDEGKQLELPQQEVPRVGSEEFLDNDIEEGEIVEEMDHKTPGSHGVFENAYEIDSPTRNEGPPGFKRKNGEHSSSGQREVHESLSQEIGSRGKGDTGSSSGMNIIAQDENRMPKKRKFFNKDEGKQLELPENRSPQFISVDLPVQEVEEGEILAEMDHHTSESPSTSGFKNALPMDSPKRDKEFSKFIDRKKGKYVSSDHRRVLKSPSQEINARTEGDSQAGELSFDKSNHKTISVDSKDPNYMVSSPKLSPTDQSTNISKSFIQTLAQKKQRGLLQNNKLPELGATDIPEHSPTAHRGLNPLDHKSSRPSNVFSDPLIPNVLRGTKEQTLESEKDEGDLLDSHSEDMETRIEGNSQGGNTILEGTNYNKYSHDMKSTNSVEITPRIPPIDHQLIENTQRQLHLSELFKNLFGEESPKGPSFTKDLHRAKDVSQMHLSDACDNWSEIKGFTDDIDMSPVEEHNPRTTPKLKQEHVPLGNENQHIIPSKTDSNRISDTDEIVLHSSKGKTFVQNSPPHSPRVRQSIQNLIREESPKAIHPNQKLQRDADVHNRKSSDESDDWAKKGGITDDINMPLVDKHNSRIASKLKQDVMPIGGGIQKSLGNEDQRIIAPKINSNKISDTGELGLQISGGDTSKNSAPHSSRRIWNGKGEELEKEIPPKAILSVTNPTSISIESSPSGMASTSTHVQKWGSFLDTIHSGKNTGELKYDPQKEGTNIWPKRISIKDSDFIPPPRADNTGGDQPVPDVFRLFGVDIRPADHNR